MRALLIGGGMDGQVMEVLPTDTVHGMEPHKPGLDPATGITWGRHVEYRRTEVAVFGTTFAVYVLDGWPQERMEATLSDLLLSDFAKSLAESR